MILKFLPFDEMEALWQRFFQQLQQSESVDIPSSLKACKAAKTDEDRIVLAKNLCESLNFKPILLIYLKDAMESEEFRMKGNKFYTAIPVTTETYLTAFKCYCKSIALAPIGSIQQAKAYSNRSVVLWRMKKYAECLKDIERTFSLDDPDAHKSKLYLRRIKCMAALKDSALDNAIDEAMSWKNQMPTSDSARTKFNDEINRLVEHGRSIINTEEKSLGIALLPIIQNPNPEVSCASDAVAIKYNKKYGRHLVATRKIVPGEVLVVEKPYVMLLGSHNNKTHCHYCSNVCWAAIPCDSCIYPMYCSKECKIADWKASHDIECPIFPNLQDIDFRLLELMNVKLTTLAIRRSGGIDNLKKIIKAVNKVQNRRTKGFSEDGLYQSNQYRSIYSLVTNTEKRSGLDLLRRAFSAFITVHFLSQCPNQTLIPKNDDDAFLFVAGLMMRHEQILLSNAHNWDEVSLTSFLSADKYVTFERGMVLMPFLSLINHSCDKQIMRQSALGHMIVYSLLPIKKGQQIFDNYDLYYAISPKPTRQQKLLEDHYFSCGCVACRYDWPLRDEIKSYEATVFSSAKRDIIAEVVGKLLECIDLESLHLPNAT